MENPFKQFIPDEEPPKKRVRQTVMGNIYIKSFLFNVIEMFTAILGISIRDSIVIERDTDESKGEATD